jgi:hypothetical protein
MGDPTPLGGVSEKNKPQTRMDPVSLIQTSRTLSVRSINMKWDLSGNIQVPDPSSHTDHAHWSLHDSEAPKKHKPKKFQHFSMLCFKSA